jgi:hypothetical protein
MSAEIASTLPYPVTAAGKRNWAYAAVNPGQEPPTALNMHQTEGSFWDLLDIINPLQHLPIVGSLYRAATGDTLGGPARILGGLLFGGPVGMLAGIGGTLLAETTGADVGEHILAGVGLGKASQSYAQTASLNSQALGRTITKI